MYTYIYIYVYTYIHIYIYVYVYTCIQAVHHCRDLDAGLADAGSSEQHEPVQGPALPQSRSIELITSRADK